MLVSVCVPTRDRLPFLRKSLAGILAQTYAPLEIVISDNWSTDGTREHCLELAANDERIRYTRPPAPVGLYANHNAAFRHARGGYVCFFHDDDLYRPEIVARFVTFLDRHPSVGIVSSDWDRVDESDAPLAPRLNRVSAVGPGLEYVGRTIRSGRSAIALPGSMIRHEALPDPPFDESGPLGFSDHVTWFRIAERWDVGHVPERLWAYRQHSGALSRRRISGIAEDYGLAYGAYADEHLRRFPEAAERVARWRAAIRRYRFWVLLYEVALHFAPEGSMRRIGPGGLPLPTYRLTPEELATVMSELDRCATGPVQRSVLGLVRITAPAAGGRALAALVRYAGLARWLLRMS